MASVAQIQPPRQHDVLPRSDWQPASQAAWPQQPNSLEFRTPSDASKTILAPLGEPRLSYLAACKRALPPRQPKWLGAWGVDPCPQMTE